MNRILYSIILLAALGLSSCSENEYDPSQVDTTIMLKANVSSIDLTRAVINGDAYIGKSADGMNASVWFSNECGKYVDSTSPEAPTYIPYHTTVTYSDAAPMPVYVNPETQTEPLSYPIGTSYDEVYCVGLYPASSWSVSDGGRIASHVIDGKTDIMFSDQIKGAWDNPFTAQQYRHLLTWLKFEASITKVEAAEQWGAITSIRVVNPYNQVNIDFGDENSSTIKASSISYTGNETYIPIVENMNLPLSVVVSDVGACLCAPSTTITIEVTTEKMGTRTVTAQLKNTKNEPLKDYTQAIGKLFIINLCFSFLDDIDGMCHLLPLNEQNIDLNGN